MPEQDINVTDPVFNWARRTPYAVAIIEGDHILHYRTLCVAVLRAMAAFRAAGWEPDQLVAISMQGNVALQLVVSLALARAGLLQVWLSPGDPAEYRAARARSLGVTAVIANQDDGSLKPLAHLVPDPGWLTASDAESAPADLRVCGKGRAVIAIQSSGTTGLPKDIALTHDDVMLRKSNAEGANLPGERVMTLTGVHFWTGLNRAWYCLSSGGAFVIPPLTGTTDTLLQCMVLHQVAILACTPLHLQLLLKDIRGDAPRLPALRILRCRSAALAPGVLDNARRCISPNIYTFYGTNEFGTIAAASPELLLRYPECIGVPLDGVELQIVNDDDRKVEVGCIGRVRVRANGICPPRLPNASSHGNSSWKQGWFYPGDLCISNAEGVLFLKGRSDEVMNFDGIMVGPADIEAVLASHPAVADCAAFALPSPLHQDIPAAAVILRLPVHLEELSTYCQQRMGIRAPRQLFVIDVIPRNPMGKILRRRLTELALAHLSAAQASGHS